MASWNEITEGSQLGRCPVCLCNLAKKKLTRHVTDCYENNKVQMESLGVIRCPLDPLHILPISFLNHHLDGNCQEAQNLLRKFYQKNVTIVRDFRGAPADFNTDYPEQYLSQHSKDLLYLLHQDLYGSFMNETDDDANQGQPGGQEEPGPSESRSEQSVGLD